MKYSIPALFISLVSCNFFKSSQKLLASFPFKKGKSVSIYTVPASATTNMAIIVKEDIGAESKRLDFFEHYNALQNYEILNDSILQITIIDSVYPGNVANTFTIKVR